MNWQPMQDRILVQRMDEPSSSLIVGPDAYWRQRARNTVGATHIGKVLATGPGRRVPGYWYKRGMWAPDENGIQQKISSEWEWEPAVRHELNVKVGQMVAFGRFTDWDVDGVVLIQEADVMFVIPDAVKIGIDAFVHNAVGVERQSGSIEEMFD